MQIGFLGHAGFCVETEKAVVTMDPWLSPHGAFDSAWFQFPCNHHLGDYVRGKLTNSDKEQFVYISHEHNDHFDPDFLITLPREKVTFVVPKFERAALRHELQKFQPKAIVACEHGRPVPIPGGVLHLYLDDSGLNRDSAILLQADEHAFLNLNDCKLYDEVSGIAADQGPISAFACQFSGATWHPTCYEYAAAEYNRIACHKFTSKFEVVARAIEVLQPRFYLPSAGPACFLDPLLIHLNFEAINIFPRASKFLEYLGCRLEKSQTSALDISPGDVFDLKRGDFIRKGEERVEEQEFEAYIRAYSERHREVFAALRSSLSNGDGTKVLDRLRTQLTRKLAEFTLSDRVRLPLYFELSDVSSALLRIDFPNRAVEIVRRIREADFYSIKCPSWQVARLLDNKITWEQFALTFRMRISRRPDVYQTLIQGFLLMEPEDMNSFCEKFVAIEEKQARVIVEAGGTRYSIDQYCPHQGANLMHGWLDQGRLWTCPRHRWQFALDKEGRCLTSDTSINAVCLEGD